jgi:hypothetical protein
MGYDATCIHYKSSFYHDRCKKDHLYVDVTVQDVDGPIMRRRPCNKGNGIYTCLDREMPTKKNIKERKFYIIQ